MFGFGGQVRFQTLRSWRWSDSFLFLWPLIESMAGGCRNFSAPTDVRTWHARHWKIYYSAGATGSGLKKNWCFTPHLRTHIIIGTSTKKHVQQVTILNIQPWIPKGAKLSDHNTGFIVRQLKNVSRIHEKQIVFHLASWMNYSIVIIISSPIRI